MNNPFTAVHDASRNGCEYLVRHPLVRSFTYSDGVKEFASTSVGCFWFLDIVAFEVTQAYTKHAADLDYMGFVRLVAKDSSARITLAKDSGEKPVYDRKIPFTDMPDGEWLFYMCKGDTGYFMHLPSEY